ncbi:MAG: hypothetical protein EPN84_03380 [Legionella sp.]|nr:MAG: hypothetical protein EPN84_03380 [Legionella sp.]
MKIKTLKYLSWSALFAGAVAGVGLNFLLNLLALGLGLASFSIGILGETVFSWIGFFCFCLSAIVAMFATGWIAGKLTPHNLQSRYWGVLIGFLSWSILLMFTIILITNMIQYAAFHSNFTSNLVEIRLKSNAPMLTGTTAQMLNHAPLSFNIETHNKIISLNALLTFLLFLIGSIASALGGFLGYSKSPRLNDHS